jgi:hypothetical protein
MPQIMGSHLQFLSEHIGQNYCSSCLDILAKGSAVRSSYDDLVIQEGPDTCSRCKRSTTIKRAVKRDG